MFMSVILRFGYACAFDELVDGCGAKRPCIGETQQLVKERLKFWFYRS